MYLLIMLYMQWDGKELTVLHYDLKDGNFESKTKTTDNGKGQSSFVERTNMT